MLGFPRNFRKDFVWRVVTKYGRYVNMVDIKTVRWRRGPGKALARKALPDNSLTAIYTATHGFAEQDLRQAIELLFFAYRDMTAGPDEMLARMGLGRAHHRVIHFVGRNPGITVAELLGILRISKQSLARVLKEVVERGLTLFGGLLLSGMERGEFRKMPVQHAVRLCIAPLLLAAIWRTTFAPLDATPYDYAGLVEAHVSTLLRGLQAEERAA